MRRTLLIVLSVFLLTLAGCLAGTTSQGTPTGTATDSPTPSVTSTETPENELEGELVIHFLDVGQADATVIQFPNGETMVIDTGDWPAEGDAVIEFLEDNEIDRVDHLVATHPHADHIGGHAEVIEHFETEHDGVGAIYDSGIAHTSQTFEDYLNAIETHDVDLFTVEEGDELEMGDAAVSFVNPPTGGESEELHDNSVSLVVRYGESSTLFTGDAETDVEERLVADSPSAIDVDTYQVGHHGSTTSSSASFLDTVDPNTVVISSALDSQYGHPHEETLEAFAERGYTTYWTAVHGDVTLVTDGSNVTFETEREGPVEADALQAEKPAEDAMIDPPDFGVAPPRSG